MGIIIGLVITIGSVLGGYMAMGGHINVLIQPFEFVIIGGAAIGIFIVANPMSTLKDSGKAVIEGIKNSVSEAARNIWNCSACCTSCCAS